MFGPRVSWSIFNYGRTKNLIRIEDARFQQLIVNYQDTVLKAAQEVEDSMTGFLNAQLATESRARPWLRPSKSVDLAFSQYREGATDYERVLDSQRTLLAQENTLPQTRSSVATNLIALYKALGGGWEMRLEQPLVPEAMQERDGKAHQLGRLFFAGASAGAVKPVRPPSGQEFDYGLEQETTETGTLSRSPWSIAAFFGYQYWQGQKNAVPEGIAWGNGRLEAKLVDITSKEALRVKEVLVDEGDVVKPGQVLARMDTVTLDARARPGQGERGGGAGARWQSRIPPSSGKRARSSLAKIEAERSGKLLAENAGSQREYDVRKTAVDSSRPRSARKSQSCSTAQQQVEVAQANVATIQTRIDDATLKAPVQGRVLYRLAEPGEVLGAGRQGADAGQPGRCLHGDLPAFGAGRARRRLGPKRASPSTTCPAAPRRGTVSFVSPEAQFTPKQVETRSERDKLMFRVKIQLPKEVVTQFIEHIKTGVRGVGYVKIDDSAVWPDWLQNLIAPAASAPASTIDTTAGRGGAGLRLLPCRRSPPHPAASRSSPSRKSPIATARSWRSTRSRSTFQAASWWASSVRTASASPRSWHCWPARSRCRKAR